MFPEKIKILPDSLSLIVQGKTPFEVNRDIQNLKTSANDWVTTKLEDLLITEPNSPFSKDKVLLDLIKSGTT